MDGKQTPRAQEHPQMSDYMMTRPSSVDDFDTVAFMREFSAPPRPLQQSTEDQSSWGEGAINPGISLFAGYSYAEDLDGYTSGNQTHFNQGEQDNYLDAQGSQPSTFSLSLGLYTRPCTGFHGDFGATQTPGGQSQMTLFASSTYEGFRYTAEDFAEPEDLQSQPPGSKRKLSRGFQVVNTRSGEDQIDPAQPQKRRRMRPSGINPPIVNDEQSPAPDRKRKKSKLATKEATLPRPAGKNHQTIGEVKMGEDGVLRWYDKATKTWLKAAYHEAYRREFIETDAALGSYDETPESGLPEDAYNVTSYCHLMRTWTSAKESICDSQGRKVLCMLEKPDGWKHNPDPGLMMHNGLVMLDSDNNAVRDFANGPRTLSSAISGMRLEGLRRVLGWTIADMMARMPSHRLKKSGIKPLQEQQLFTNEMLRFRKRENVTTWIDRGGSQAIKKDTLDRLRVQDPGATSTESLQPRTKTELKALDDLNKGKFGYRSRYLQENSATSSTGGNFNPSPNTNSENNPGINIDPSLHQIADIGHQVPTLGQMYTYQGSTVVPTALEENATQIPFGRDNEGSHPFDLQTNKEGTREITVMGSKKYLGAEKQCPTMGFAHNGPSDKQFTDQAERSQPRRQGSNLRWQKDFPQQGAYSTLFSQTCDADYVEEPQEFSPQDRGVSQAPTFTLPHPAAEPARPSQKRKREVDPFENDPSPLSKRQDQGQSDRPEDPLVEGELANMTEEAKNPPLPADTEPSEGFPAQIGSEDTDSCDFQDMLDPTIDFSTITAEELDNIFSPLVSDENQRELHAIEDQETGSRNCPPVDTPTTSNISEEHLANEAKSKSQDGQNLEKTDDVIRLSPRGVPILLESVQISQDEVSSIHDSSLDFRMILPRNEIEEEIIQRALSATRADYRIRTGSFPAPTPRRESYSVQVDEILDEFTNYWNNLNQSPDSQMPELVTSVDIWGGGFEGWVPAPGGDILESLVKAGEQGPKGQGGGQLDFWRVFFQSF